MTKRRMVGVGVVMSLVVVAGLAVWSLTRPLPGPNLTGMTRAEVASLFRGCPWYSFASGTVEVEKWRSGGVDISVQFDQDGKVKGYSITEPGELSFLDRLRLRLGW